MFVDEFAGSADEVGDDGEEPGVDLVLRGVDGGDAFGLGDGVQTLVVPGERDLVRQLPCPCGLFTQRGPVPGEVGAFDDRAAGVGVSELGRSAAEGVIGVAPAGAVGGDGGGEAVFGVPLVAPCLGIAGQAGLLAHGDAAEGVVFVTDVAGAGDAGAGVRTLTRRFVLGVGGRPGSGGLVACRVVGVCLGPGGGVSFGYDFKPPRKFAERDHANIVQWNEYDRGGHWAAHEAPDLLLADIRGFFAKVV